MKVFEINSVSGIRSTGRICTDLADVLKENGHVCRIAYGRESVPETYRSISYRIGSEFDVRLHALKARVFDSAGSGSKKATQKLIGEIRAYEPDLIHLHNLHGYYLDIGSLFRFLAQADIPVVWTLHDCWAFTGHCAHFAAVKCERWKQGCHDCPQKKNYPASWLLDCSESNWNKKRALFTGVGNMTLVTPSMWLAELVGQSFLADCTVQVIPNGVDLTVFRPRASDFRERYGLQGKKIVLGVATAWSERKGLNEFCELAGTLDDRYQVVLAGLAPEQIRALPQGVLGITPTNNAEELAEIYTAADVFLNLGKEETMGLTTVEAMACGTPVVVSNLAAVPETVAEAGGLVLESLSSEAIRSGIEKALDLRFDPRRNAENYEKKRQYLKYLDLYQAILK